MRREAEASQTLDESPPKGWKQCRSWPLVLPRLAGILVIEGKRDRRSPVCPPPLEEAAFGRADLSGTGFGTKIS